MQQPSKIKFPKDQQNYTREQTFTVTDTNIKCISIIIFGAIIVNEILKLEMTSYYDTFSNREHHRYSDS